MERKKFYKQEKYLFFYNIFIEFYRLLLYNKQK